MRIRPWRCALSSEAAGACTLVFRPCFPPGQVKEVDATGLTGPVRRGCTAAECWTAPTIISPSDPGGLPNSGDASVQFSCKVMILRIFGIRPDHQGEMAEP